MSNVINLPTYEQVAEVLAQVLDIDIKVGVPNTSASNVTTANAHAKLNYLLNVLGVTTATASNATSAVAHAKLNWLLANLPTISGHIGAPTTAASDATSAVVHAKLNWLLNNAGKSIKSVQSGQLNYGQTTGITSMNIPLTAVNVSKCFVIINGKFKVWTSGSNYELDAANDFKLNSTSITLRNILGSVQSTQAVVNWQVIEFY